MRSWKERENPSDARRSYRRNPKSRQCVISTGDVNPRSGSHDASFDVHWRSVADRGDNAGMGPDQRQSTGHARGRQAQRHQGAANPKLPDLNLTNEQREQIRKGVLGRNTEVEFQRKSTKPAKDFVPAVGAKLPKGVEGHSLPAEVLAQLPQLRDYKYVTMKDQVLIVNGMTKDIVDVFPETRPLI